MFAATSNFQDTRLLSIFAVLAAILAVLIWRALTHSMRALFLVLCHNNLLSDLWLTRFILGPKIALVKDNEIRFSRSRAYYDCALRATQR